MSHGPVEIGLFQLENLASTPTRFLFYDLRRAEEPLPEHLDKLLKKAARVAPENLLATLAPIDKQAPLVLVCEDGKTSLNSAHALEAAGYSQIYIIDGGVEGLLKELGVD